MMAEEPRPRWKCACCGIGEITQCFTRCKVCGWIDDYGALGADDGIGKENEMSLFDARKLWEKTREYRDY